MNEEGEKLRATGNFAPFFSGKEDNMISVPAATRSRVSEART